MAAEGHEMSAGDYIVHHLTHFGTGKAKSLVDFSVINYDSIVFSTLLGVVACWLLWKAARRATSGVPGRFQAAVEILFEMVEGEGAPPQADEQTREFALPADDEDTLHPEDDVALPPQANDTMVVPIEDIQVDRAKRRPVPGAVSSFRCPSSLRLDSGALVEHRFRSAGDRVDQRL